MELYEKAEQSVIQKTRNREVVEIDGPHLVSVGRDRDALGAEEVGLSNGAIRNKFSRLLREARRM